jgi:agmatinase
MTTRELLALLRSLVDLNLVGADVVEVAPAYDSPGQITALLGATIAWEAVSIRALARAAAPMKAGE